MPPSRIELAIWYGTIYLQVYNLQPVFLFLLTIILFFEMEEVNVELNWKQMIVPPEYTEEGCDS